MFKFKSFINYKLFNKLNKKLKNIVFYSEGQEHDHFFLPFVQECLDQNIPFDKINSLQEGSDWINPNGEIVYNNILTVKNSDPYRYAFCSDTRYNDL